MRILLIEDRKETVEDVTQLFQDIDHSIIVVGSAPSMDFPLSLINMDFPPDVILVNDRIANKKLWSLRKSYPVKTRLTFTTPHTEYHFRVLRSNQLVDFLHKLPAESGPGEPVNLFSSAANIKKRFLVRHGRKMISVEASEIAYFLLENRCVFIRMKAGQKFVTAFRLSELSNMLDPAQFFQVNRSYIVSIDAISHVLPYPGHRLNLFVLPEPGANIVVSREKVNAFKQWLGE